MDTTADHSILDTEIAEKNNQPDLILSQYTGKIIQTIRLDIDEIVILLFYQILVA